MRCGDVMRCGLGNRKITDFTDFASCQPLSIRANSTVDWRHSRGVIGAPAEILSAAAGPK